MPCFSSKVFCTWLHFRNATKIEVHWEKKSLEVKMSLKVFQTHFDLKNHRLASSSRRELLVVWVDIFDHWIRFHWWEHHPLELCWQRTVSLVTCRLMARALSPGPRLLHMDQARKRNLRAALSWAAFALEVPWALIVLVKTSYWLRTQQNQALFYPGCV